MSVSRPLFGHCRGGHKTVEEYRTIFGESFWEYDSFTFIRNPYMRLVSADEYLMRGGHPAWTRNRVFRRDVLGPYDGFGDFMKHELQLSANEGTPIHVSPQTHFLELNGHLGVDCVGRYERLRREFYKICSSLGPGLTGRRIRLRHRVRWVSDVKTYGEGSHSVSTQCESPEGVP